eukprot:3738812-Karenia_brevis.AAC.1
MHPGKTKIMCNRSGGASLHKRYMNISGEKLEILTANESIMYLGRLLSLSSLHDKEDEHRL